MEERLKHESSFKRDPFPHGDSVRKQAALWNFSVTTSLNASSAASGLRIQQHSKLVGLGSKIIQTSPEASVPAETQTKPQYFHNKVISACLSNNLNSNLTEIRSKLLISLQFPRGWTFLVTPNLSHRRRMAQSAVCHTYMYETCKCCST